MVWGHLAPATAVSAHEPCFVSRMVNSPHAGISSLAQSVLYSATLEESTEKAGLFHLESTLPVSEMRSRRRVAPQLISDMDCNDRSFVVSRSLD